MGDRVVSYINQIYRVEDLLLEIYGVRVHLGAKFLCPFHNDNRRSAKLFEDNSFFCFAEGKQYSPYWILIKAGKKHSELARLVPQEFVNEHEKRKYFDVEFYREMTIRLTEYYKKSNDLFGLIDNWNSIIQNKEPKK